MNVSVSAAFSTEIGVKTYLFVHIQLPEDLRRVQQVLVVHNLLRIPCQQWQVEKKCNPIPVDEEEECQEGMNGGFRDDIRVETVAEVDWVDVIAKFFVSKQLRKARHTA